MTDKTGQSGSENAQISEWVQQLGNDDSTIRQDARQSLTKLGEAAVPELIVALDSSSDLLRWESAKLLTEIQHTSAIPTLIKTLADNNSSIRWVAGDAIIAFGEVAIEPLLQALLDDTTHLREGAYHVLYSQATENEQFRDLLQPVVTALKSLDAAVSVPVEAEKALLHITELKQDQEEC